MNRHFSGEVESTVERHAAFFAGVARQAARDWNPFRKAYIKAVVDRIEVDDHAIRIIGDQATLEE
jgi:hypothetical protein